MPAIGTGAVCLWPGGMLWIGATTGSTGFHRHHAIQISFADSGPIEFQFEDRTEWREYHGCIIASDRAHAFRGVGRTCAHVWVEPESAEGRSLAERLGRRAVAGLPAGAADARTRLFAAWGERQECGRLSEIARDVIRSIVGTKVAASPTDPRVLQAIQLIRSRLDGEVRLADIATAVDLSPGRFRHLFVAETETTFSSYVLWQRLHRVFEAIGAGGVTLSRAAHEAGFADAAHMTRTFRRMLGMAPSRLEAVRLTREAGGEA